MAAAPPAPQSNGGANRRGGGEGRRTNALCTPDSLGQELLPAKLPFINVLRDGGGTMCCFLMVGAVATVSGIYLVHQDLIKGACLTLFGVFAFLTPFFSICFAYVKHHDMAELAKRTGITCSMTIHGPLLTQQTPTVSTIFREGLQPSSDTTTALITSEGHKITLGEPNGRLPPLPMSELRRPSLRNLAQTIEDTNIDMIGTFQPPNGNLKRQQNVVTTQPTLGSTLAAGRNVDPGLRQLLDPS